MLVLNVAKFPASEQSWNSVETSLDAADTSVRATILQQIRNIRLLMWGLEAVKKSYANTGATKDTVAQALACVVF